MNKLDGMTAIVTGAGRGIGKAIASALASEGAHTVVASRTERELEALVSDLRSKGLSAEAMTSDITDDGQAKRLVEFASKHSGRIDILVNNAGMGVLKPFSQLEVSEFDKMWRLNMRAAFVMTKLALPFMIEQNSGAIVNIASLAGKNSFVNGTGYAATKWALRGWASSLMLEVREYNIRVVTIFPGSVDTTFSPTIKRGDKITQPQDVADAVLFAVTAPARSMFSEIDVRPTNPK
ncbi:MAG: SDR family oxidoreductase [Ignavibacteriae bacterium]|nr:SDR family oxidoreductase [Ignavibacteriota bacterium]